MQRSRTKSKARSVQRILILLCVGLILFALTGLLLWPAGSTSAQSLLNRIFEASEAVNSYVYDRFPVAEDSSITPALCLSGLIALCLTALCFLTSGSLLPLLLAICLAGIQAYHGLSLPAAANIGCFGLLAVAIVYKHAGIRAVPLMCALLLAIALAAVAWLPGTNAGIEAASEKARDWLSVAIESSVSNGIAQPPQRMETRHENRRDLMEGAGSALAGQDYQLVTVEEQLIAQPHWIDYLRIAFLCLMIPIVLAVPFAPFVWMNSRSRKAAKKYACLDDPDCASAIDGMFSLVIGYLDACSVGDPSALHSRRMDGAGALLPAAYKELYRQGAKIWQETVYSEHAASQEQRSKVEALLNETEILLYEQTSWKTKLRIKYICCLHG